jgi:hypothetical protein
LKFPTSHERLDAIAGLHLANFKSQDFNAVGKYIGDKIAAVVAASGTSGDSQGHGQTVARELFPDVRVETLG